MTYCVLDRAFCQSCMKFVLFFLCGKIVLVAVIKQALLQVEVNQSRRGFLQSLWFLTPDNPSK